MVDMDTVYFDCGDGSEPKQIYAQPQGRRPMLLASAKDKAQIEVSYDHNEKGQKARAQIPLTRSKMSCVIHDGLAKMEMQFNFTNRSTTNPVEATLDFPKDDETIISSLTIHIGGKLVQARVEEQEKAKAKYTDAIQQGKVATITTTKKNGQGLTLVFGNLAPGASAEVTVNMSKYVEVEGGALSFRLPICYFPNYNLNEINPSYVDNRLAQGHNYDFSYEVELASAREITWASVPADGKIIKASNQSIVFKNNPTQKIPKTDLMFYYTTVDMQSPQTMYQMSEKYPDQVACLTSFAPCAYNKVNQQIQAEQPQITVAEIPNHIIEPKEPYCFTFLVDRSLSMADGIRMKTTRDALILFMQSLPANCAFNILCFGGKKFDWICSNKSQQYYEYTDNNRKLALDRIKNFHPDYIGTNILKPLQMAYSLPTPGYMKNIFLLTDGEVQNPQEIVDFVEEQTNKPGNGIRTHAFGIGDGCDTDLCKAIAEAGRGSYSFAEDGTPDLRHLVIKALKKASQQSLENCRITWGQEDRKCGEIFAADLFTSMKIIPKNQFEQLKVEFYAQNDPYINNEIQIRFFHKDFRQIPDGVELFQHAVIQQIQASEEPATNKQHLHDAIKYQVLTDATAMVAVIKMDTKVKGEMIEAKIPFGKKLINAESEKVLNNYGGDISNLDPSEIADARNKMGITGEETRGTSSDLQTLLQTSEYDELDKMLELPEIQAVFEEFDYDFPVDKSEFEDLVQMMQTEDDIFETFADRFVDVYSVLKFRLDNNTYHLTRPPTFQEFVMMQESNGNWPEDSFLKLESLLEGDIKDPKIRSMVKVQNSKDEIIFTLVALYCLLTIWDDKQDEWEMIARKAKLWLKKVGINDPMSLVEQMNFVPKKYE